MDLIRQAVITLQLFINRGPGVPQQEFSEVSLLCHPPVFRSSGPVDQLPLGILTIEGDFWLLS